jgi:hypothetical protein
LNERKLVRRDNPQRRISVYGNRIWVKNGPDL